MLLPKEFKYAAIGGGVAIFGVIFGWVLFPIILKSQVKKEMALSKKTDVRKMWEKIPFALDFKVYMFNFTNPDEIQKGAVPIVKEVGPYYFAEWKEKVEIEDHEEDDTVSYKRKDAFYFEPEKSGKGLTGEEEIVTPHILMVAAVTTISREKPAMLKMVGKALDGILDNPTNIFLRAKVMDILFRGVMINCDRTEFAPKAACAAMKKEKAPGLSWEPNNQIRFSLFGMKNNTINPQVVTVRRGKINVMDVGRVIALDGEPSMKIWMDSCNEYQGTDGTVFPPFLTAKDRLESYSADLCRSFKPWFQKKTKYEGIRTNHYVANIGDFANDPELQCFCPAPDQCPPKGLMDLTKCISVPMYASLPHYLDCDPNVQKNVKGLTPDVNEHGIEIDFEPFSGTPMSAKQRIQFNIRLINNSKVELFKDLPGTMVPLFWVDEGLALNETFVKMLKHQLFLPKRVVNVLRWWMVAFGGLAAVAGVGYHFKDNIMRKAVSGDAVAKVTPHEEEQKKISVIGDASATAKVEM